MAALLFSSCATVSYSDYRSFDVDVEHARLTIVQNDGKEIKADLPREAMVHADKATITYQNAGFCFEGMLGADFVGSHGFIALGHRLAYAGSFGFHDLFSISPDQTRPNAFGVGLDYRYKGFLFGFNIEEPFNVLDDPGIPVRLGFIGTVAY